MPPLPDTEPDIQKVRAVVTTRWKGAGYRPLVIRSLEQYYIDTAMDNDADTWSIDIGDPDGTYLPLLSRNNEVRSQLFGVGRQGLDYILTGIADDVEYENGIWTLTGRDLSSLATDSYVLPHRWSKARAWSIVKAQAHDIGFHDTNLARHGMVKKVIYTDGSESYWDFWYRLYRREKMWLWTTPHGVLVGGKLNYSADPLYYLGDARRTDHAAIKSRIIPVIQATLRKSTQGRIEEVVIYGTKGDTGFSTTVRDPTLKQWKKKSRKVMLDTTSRTVQAARKMAWEEIFEGKVGSLEYKIVIPDPGFVVQTNQIARLYLEDIGLYGNFYVVGSRIIGGTEGFQQEVRLREPEYAMSRRVPEAPKLASGEPSPGKLQGTSLGKNIEQQAGIPRGWGDYFVKAAKKFHGTVDYSLFLACLLGICHVETGFINERQNGGPGRDHIVWYPFKPPSYYENLPGQILPGGMFETRAEYEIHFANEPGAHGVHDQRGVGPMQLTSIGLKQSADDLLRPGHRDQYEGGRWHPEHNIMIAGRELHSACQALHVARDQDVWIAVDAYNRGVAGAQSYFAANKSVSPYAQEVRKAVNSDPGYLAKVKTAIQNTKDAQQTSGQGWTSTDNGAIRQATKYGGYLQVACKPADIKAFFQRFDRATATAAQRRKAIWYTAIWGCYCQDSIDYDQVRPMKDMKPPPNVPNPSDCSQYATWCYEAAGAPDPNGNAYNGQGNTSTLWAHGKSISYAQLRPGDLIFYSSPAHVVVYVGNGYLVSMGCDPDPNLYAFHGYRSDLRGFRTYSTT